MKLRPIFRSNSAAPQASADGEPRSLEVEAKRKRSLGNIDKKGGSVLALASLPRIQVDSDETNSSKEIEEPPNVIPATVTDIPTLKDDEKESSHSRDGSPFRRRFSSGNQLTPSNKDNIEGLLLNNVGATRHRSGSFNHNILGSHSHQAFIDVGRERSLTADSGVPQRHIAMHTSSATTSPIVRPRRRNTTHSKQAYPFLLDDDLDSLEEGDFEIIQCFLPTGVIMDVNVHPDDEIYQIKQIVLSTATTDEYLPLRGCLNPDAQSYVVSYISPQGHLEEVMDETKTLRELKPFENIVKLTKHSKDKRQYHIKKNVGKLIGKDMKQFDEIRNVEVNDFRWRMKVFANRIAQERKQRLRDSWRDRILYQYPPRLVCLTVGISQVPEKMKLNIMWNNHQEHLEVLGSITPAQLIKILAPLCNVDVGLCGNFCAKAIGEETYLVGDDHSLINYAYIYNRVTTNRPIKLVIINFETVDIVRANDGVYVLLDNDVSLSTNSVRSSSLSSSNTMQQLQAIISSSEIDERFVITVKSIKLAPEYVGLGSQRTIGIQMGLFHGNKPLCPTLTHILKGPSDESGVYGIDKDFDFEIPISNLPRMAKLCIGVFEKKRNNQQPLFWVNTNVFDYKAKLKWKDTLHLWHYSMEMTPTHGSLSPLRHTICNPNISEATDMVITFMNDENGAAPKIYYTDECYYSDMDNVAVVSSNGGGTSSNINDGTISTINKGTTSSLNEGTISKLYRQELEQIALRDPLHDITIQEKDLVWKVREHCRIKLPHLLPRIIDCVDYGRPDEVSELHSLIERWPLMPVENSLQLLDYAYPDPMVRSYAVRCLRKGKDSIILVYLLQLAQALKHENYLQCDLVEFLLERALNNQHIGHFLFWELKAEMTVPSVGLMYGLVLEAYLSAAPEHLKILEHQVTFLEKCLATHSATQGLDSGTTKDQEKCNKRFVMSLRSQFNGHHPFRNVVNPLKPSEKCYRLQLDKCRRMNSKKRPQLLSFQNIDVHFWPTVTNDLEDINIMFKKGDDLRQDRLTLQLLSVMDNLWRGEGLDLRLCVYGVMATGPKEGFIEVVQQAETICQIQLSQTEFKKTAVFRKGLLLAWLRAHNPTPEKLQQAQWEFTQSCAGYTVAAYVLGIGDRHNDNIMIKRNGQMFHIDFGHFLGNFKHKFGIKRERVRLVLSSDFVEVIKADLGHKKNFERFRDLCEKAFLTIRRQGCLVISLLAMMISTGLPELSSEQDLNTIRNTLHLDRSEDEAMECFRKDFDESLRNAWTISVDWWFHSMNQLRTKTDKKS